MTSTCPPSKYHTQSAAGEFDTNTQLQEYTVRKEIKDIKGKQYLLNELWDNKQLGLEVGNLLKIRIEAVDNSPAKNTAISEEILVPIISEAEWTATMRLSQEFVERLSTSRRSQLET